MAADADSGTVVAVVAVAAVKAPRDDADTPGGEEDEDPDSSVPTPSIVKFGGGE